MVTGVRQDDRIIQEEVFGPVVTVQSFRSEEEALAMATASRTAWPRRCGPPTSAAPPG